MAQRAVLITGAGIGIGRATVIAFVRGGDHVVVTDVLENEGKGVAAEIQQMGGSAEFHGLDVTSASGVDAVVGAVEAGGLSKSPDPSRHWTIGGRVALSS